jgi:WD40 repeat protein
VHDPSIRTGYSQDASHKTGLDISALDINRERTHAVLAGTQILKTVRVHDAKIVDETNLRAVVLSHADPHARQRDGLGIEDVKWSHGQFSSHIATAAANGKVILYDLNRANVELTRLHEHNRQVHKLAFNPHQGYLLLSASRDTTVRLWDLRDMRRDVSTCRSRDQYSGINGGIRDVQWSPTDAVEFAFGTDNGNIQRWDFRYNKGPKQRITAAHDQRICTSIDWHPDGKHLLSSGHDKTVKVWDLSADGRRQKAAWVLKTPFPVDRARWRPPCWSNRHQERGAYECTQVATAYHGKQHPAIHVWDFRRPHVPFREINKYPSPPSDMLWHSRDTLWTVGKEGVFQQTDVHHAPKIVDRRALQAFAVSPSGEVSGVAQRRPRRRRSASLAYTDDSYDVDRRGRRSSPEKSVMRSSADDSLDDSFLAASLKHHHGRTASNRSARSFGSTPPSDPAPKVMFLTDSLTLLSETSRANQVAFRGLLPGAGNVQIFAYLAQKYKSIPLLDPPDLHAFEELEYVFSQNAQYAQRASLHRLAATWKLVGQSIASVTRRRAELHKERRSLQPGPNASTSLKSAVESTPEDSGAQDKHAAITANPAVRAILGTLDKASSSQLTPVFESTSNLATPLARPLAVSSTIRDDLQGPGIPDLDQEDIVPLPPSLTGPNTVGADPMLALPQSTFNGPKWYQSAAGLDERRAMVGSYRASPRIPLSLGPSNTSGIDISIPPLERHGSGESFAMFSASTDSPKGNSIPSSFASSNSHPLSVESNSNQWQRETEMASFGNSRSNTTKARDGESRKSMEISPTTLPVDGREPPKAGIQQASIFTPTDHVGEVSSSDKAVQDMELLRRNNQLLRHDSSESEAYASSRDDSTSSFEYNTEMDASGTIVPEGPYEMTSPQVLRPIAAPTPSSPESAPPVPNVPTENKLMLADYQAMHVDVEVESAYPVIGLLNSLLEFHTSAQSDAQFGSIMLLLLAPLLPQTHNPANTTNIDVGEVLTTFSDTFIALGLTSAQAKAVLSTQLSQLIATGINPYQAESILSTYHAQLHSLSLFNSAASLRRLAYPAYPAVYEQALKDTQIGLLCLSCKSPINNPKDKMRCESCKRAQAPCPICWGKYPAFEPITAQKKAKHKTRSSFQDRDHRRKRSSLISYQAPGAVLHENSSSPSSPENWSPQKATLWTWCSLCGHGGHTNCLSTWFADPHLSDGACATEGCLCDCVRGKRRDEKMEEALRLKAAKDRSKPVRKGDDWNVRESKAVSAVRRALDDPPPSPPPQQQQQTQPTVRKDDGRRVRVLAPALDPRASTGPFPTPSSKLPNSNTQKA